MLRILGSILTVIAAYYCYKWGAGEKEEPHPAVLVLVMLLCLWITVPAYYIGKHNRKAA